MSDTSCNVPWERRMGLVTDECDLVEDGHPELFESSASIMPSGKAFNSILAIGGFMP